MTVKSTDATDKYVGSRVRMRRMMLGMSQTTLGEALGVSFQQVQKYEKGANRIGASRIQHVAQILQVPIGFFFDGVAGGPNHSLTPSYASDFLASSEGLALARAFMQIDDVKLRRCIVNLVEEIAEVDAPPSEHAVASPHPV